MTQWRVFNKAEFVFLLNKTILVQKEQKKYNKGYAKNANSLPANISW